MTRLLTGCDNLEKIKKKYGLDSSTNPFIVENPILVRKLSPRANKRVINLRDQWKVIKEQ
jgi:hypothetical protein